MSNIAPLNMDLCPPLIINAKLKTTIKCNKTQNIRRAMKTQSQHSNQKPLKQTTTMTITKIVFRKVILYKRSNRDIEKALGAIQV